MSSRVLRKLQGDNNKELVDEPTSDIETDLPTSGGARRKQLNINRYDLLNQQSHSESEVKEDDNETEANNAPDNPDGHELIKRKKKKRKKKSGKSIKARRSSEDNADMDEIERTVREVNRMFGESHASGPSADVNKYSSAKRNILGIQHRNLNANNELKRIFGLKIIQSEHRRKNRGRGSHLKSTWLVTPKENWPQVSKHGLSMSLIESKDNTLLFSYEHSSSYQQVQKKFLEAVESLNPDNIVAIINNHPYHIDALIQLSDLCRLSEDLAMAAELIERALYCLEYAFHSLFNLAQGNCRLDYRRQENRSFFITLFKHLIFVGGRACYRTALEFCKVLLSIDPEGDPLAVVLTLDFYALKSREYEWFVQFVKDWEAKRNLLQLPNIAFSLAMAHFHLATGTDESDRLLQNALIMFPGVLMPLLEKCLIQINARLQNHEYFGAKAEKQTSASLATLVKLYVCRTYHVWKESNVLLWLERNVHAVLDRIDSNSNDEYVKDCEEKRAKRYQGTPRNILRHILLSDIKEVTIPLSEETRGPVLGFDPIPPPDSINLYTRPKGPTRLPSNTSAVGIFFQSLLPTFNLSVQELQERFEDGARGGPAANGAEDESNGIDLRRSVASLVDAMRDLLSNVRLPDVPNDADVDDSGNSEEDDDDDEDDADGHNYYLT